MVVTVNLFKPSLNFKLRSQLHRIARNIISNQIIHIWKKCQNIPLNSVFQTFSGFCEYIVIECCSRNIVSVKTNIYWPLWIKSRYVSIHICIFLSNYIIKSTYLSTSVIEAINNLVIRYIFGWVYLMLQRRRKVQKSVGTSSND